MASLQAFVLGNIPFEDGMDTMAIPWILSRPGVLDLQDCMGYSGQMPRCSSDLKCRYAGWSATVLELRHTYVSIIPNPEPSPSQDLPLHYLSSNTDVKPRAPAKLLSGSMGSYPWWALGMRSVPPGFYHQDLHLGHQGQFLENRGLLAVGLGHAHWQTVLCGEVVHTGLHFREEMELSGLLFLQRRAARRDPVLGGRASEGRLVG